MTVIVEVLFIEASKSWAKDFESFTSGKSLKLIGFDNLKGLNWKRYSAVDDQVETMKDWAGGIAPSSLQSLVADVDAIILRSHGLREKIGLMLEAHGAKDGESLTFKQCEGWVKANVVVELLLQPMSRLRDVVTWRNENDII